MFVRGNLQPGPLIPPDDKERSLRISIVVSWSDWELAFPVSCLSCPTVLLEGLNAVSIRVDLVSDEEFHHC